MHNGIEPKKVTLSTGEVYTPQKGKPPVYPCLTCPPEKLRKCLLDYNVCSVYMDYEHMNAIYKTAVFDQAAHAAKSL